MFFGACSQAHACLALPLAMMRMMGNSWAHHPQGIVPLDVEREGKLGPCRFAASS